MSESIATESLSYGETDITLREIATDLQEAHRELDEYRRSSLVLAQNLKELRLKAESQGDVSVANTAKGLEDSAMAVFQRTKE
jgi:hypothetical protein